MAALGRVHQAGHHPRCDYDVGRDLIALASYGRLYHSPDNSWWPLTATTSRLANINAGRTPPLLASDDTLGLMLFGDGIAQLSRDQRAWIVRAESPGLTAFARDGQGRYWLGTRGGASRLSIEEPAWKLIPAGLDGRISAPAIDPDGYGSQPSTVAGCSARACRSRSGIVSRVALS